MTEFLDHNPTQIPFKQRLQRLLETTLSKLKPEPSLPESTSHQEEIEKAVEIPLTKEERQKSIIIRIAKNLERKGVLASPWENRVYYGKIYQINPKGSPEEFQQEGMKLGFTDIDEQTKKPKIYLHPDIGEFPLEKVLVTIIDEAIHWRQLELEGLPSEIELQRNEAIAKDKILKMAKFLELSEDKIEELQAKKQEHLVKVTSLEKK